MTDDEFNEAMTEEGYYGAWKVEHEENQQLRAQLAEQRRRADEATPQLRGVVSWMERMLDTTLKHKGYADPSGHPHGGAVAEIPEWELRRVLSDCRDALAATAKPKPPSDIHTGHRVDGACPTCGKSNLLRVGERVRCLECGDSIDPRDVMSSDEQEVRAEPLWHRRTAPPATADLLKWLADNPEDYGIQACHMGLMECLEAFLAEWSAQAARRTPPPATKAHEVVQFVVDHKPTISVQGSTAWLGFGDFVEAARFFDLIHIAMVDQWPRKPGSCPECGMHPEFECHCPNTNSNESAPPAPVLDEPKSDVETQEL